jgi:hypothetical protein
MYQKIGKSVFLFFLMMFFFTSCTQKNKEQKEQKNQNKVSKELAIAKRWSEEKANTWRKDKPWLRGANFNPSTTINQLEFWQAETFDPEIIDKELGWAEDIGLNCARVYLHHVAWETDKTGFKERINTYLSIADQNLSQEFIIQDGLEIREIYFLLQKTCYLLLKLIQKIFLNRLRMIKESYYGICIMSQEIPTTKINHCHY